MGLLSFFRRKETKKEKENTKGILSFFHRKKSKKENSEMQQSSFYGAEKKTENKKKFFSFFRRGKTKKDDDLDPTIEAEKLIRVQVRIQETEMTTLVDQLINDVIGPNGTMTRHFKKAIAGYSRETNPISEAKARTVMLDMVRMAVAERKRIVGRVEKSIEEGSLYDRYYTKLMDINMMTNETYIKLIEMKYAEREYLQMNELYDKVKKNLQRDEYQLSDDADVYGRSLESFLDEQNELMETEATEMERLLEKIEMSKSADNNEDIHQAEEEIEIPEDTTDEELSEDYGDEDDDDPIDLSGIQ